MKKICISLLLLITLQGCSVGLQKQETIQYPKNMENPSALVVHNNYLSILSMSGTITPLTKVVGSYLSENQKTKTKFYFLTSLAIFNSLWEYDLKNKTLKCLIPRFVSSHNVEDFMVSKDESYLIYGTYVVAESYDLDYIMHLFSIKKNRSIAVPKQKNFDVIDLVETIFPDQFLLVMQKNNTTSLAKNEIFLWNALTNKKKLISSCDQWFYSKEYKWLATAENETLIRYSLEDGKKEIILDSLVESQFEWVGNKPNLLVCQKSYLSGPSNYAYVTPDNKWHDVSFDMFDRINKFYTFPSKEVIFDVYNRLSRTFKAVYWNPDTNETKILYSSNQADFSFDRISENGSYIVFKGKTGDSTKNRFVVINIKEKKAKEFTNATEYAYPVSNDETIWLFHYKEDKKIQKEYLLYDWNKDVQYDIKVQWEGEVFIGDASDDGQFMTFSAYSTEENAKRKLLFFSILTGKEIKVPNAENIDFITWLTNP